MTSSSGTPGTGPGEGAALDGPIDPENPAATYVLEPDVVAPLAQRVVTSNEAGMHRSVLPFTGAPLAAFPVSSVDDVARAVEPPERSGAVAGTVRTGPVSYLVLLHVTGAARGAGVGGTLVDAALARVGDRDGEDAVVLLHHGVLNPLSAPFWARQGFRPVLTTWELPVSGPVGPTT